MTDLSQIDNDDILLMHDSLAHIMDEPGVNAKTKRLLAQIKHEIDRRLKTGTLVL